MAAATVRSCALLAAEQCLACSWAGGLVAKPSPNLAARRSKTLRQPNRGREAGTARLPRLPPFRGNLLSPRFTRLRR